MNVITMIAVTMVMAIISMFVRAMPSRSHQFSSYVGEGPPFLHLCQSNKRKPPYARWLTCSEWLPI